ncbi:MAG: ADP-dependent NAD(P)H-hydrate dehydratase, partial [Mycetocola sp.]
MAAENTGPQIAVEWTVADASRILVAPHATDNKYSRGVLAIVTGSVRYPGAAVLGVEAALRSGPGMVRFVGPDPVTHLVLARRPEIVPGPGRAQAILIGSGMDRDEAVLRWDQSVAATPPSASVPVVLDAGGITLLGRRLRLKAVTTGAGTEGDAAGEPPVVITPHAGELAALLDVDRAGVEADPVAAAVRAAARWNCVVVLKGSTTVVATPSGRARTVPVTTHWLASAGTGDVLAG